MVSTAAMVVGASAGYAQTGPGQPSSPLVAETRLFAFHSNVWVNLHHFLYVMSRARKGLDATRPATTAVLADTAGVGVLSPGRDMMRRTAAGPTERSNSSQRVATQRRATKRERSDIRGRRRPCAWTSRRTPTGPEHTRRSTRRISVSHRRSCRTVKVLHPSRRCFTKSYTPWMTRSSECCRRHFA